jgi:hypothetical protein
VDGRHRSRLPVIDADWPGVVLVLGVVGLSLAAVCFAIWTMSRPRVDEPPLTWAEGDTAVGPPRK